MAIGVHYDEFDEARERFNIKSPEQVQQMRKVFGPPKKYDYLIGIDPGVNTGFAIYSPGQKKIIYGKTFTFWQMITFLDRWILEHKKTCTFKFYIENPNLNDPVFIKRNVAPHERAKMNKVSQNVGMNKRDAQLILEYLTMQGVEFQDIRPSQHTMSKLTEAQFKKLTGCTDKLSQHARDAAMLIFGR